MSLFDKAAIFTDIHFGEKLDSEQHNQDCLEFVNWFCDQTIENECDIIIFMGDWFHNRARTENRTAHYSNIALDVLDNVKLPIYWILGNHEIYFKDNRDIHSLPILPRYRHFHLIDQITQIDDVVFSPWLVGGEKDDLIERECRYIFGHFELPFFLMNQVIEKRYDGTGLHIDEFAKCDSVYSGHFHKRQLRLNRNKIPIYYVGNCFGHNFNDVNDAERGMAILKWGEVLPQYIAWPDAPTYLRYPVSGFLDLLESGKLPHERSHIELNDDIGLADDDLVDLKAAINARYVKINPKSTTIMQSEIVTTGKNYKSVDHLVVSEIRGLNYDGKYDPNILVDLYMGV